MKDGPFISVMILCYNYGHMLPKALQACAAQSYRDFEIVMINNGSTDCTEAVYRAFCTEHPELSVTYVPVFPNDGPIHGWNIGIQYAKGVYVMFHDADDWMEPDCLEKLAEQAERTDADRIVGPYQEVGEDGTVLRVRGFLPNSPELPTAMLQGSMFRRSVVIENRLVIPEKPYYPGYDAWFVLNYASREKHCALVHGGAVYNYYFNPSSLITKEINKKDFRSEFSGQRISVPFITANAMKTAGEKERLKHQMEYLAIRHYYSNVVHCFMCYSKKDAMDYYALLHREMKELLPRYQKNPHLRPFRNQYEQPGSLVCWGLKWMERIHMMRFVRFLVTAAGRLLKRSELLRR